MLDTLLAATPVTELLFRMFTTGLVVILVALAVGWFGPLIGGALAGLPIVLGPGFFFLLGRASTEFASEAAAYAVYSLSATQIFTLAYLASASRTGAAGSIAAATLAWFAGVGLLRMLPPSPWLGFALFIACTWLARTIAHHFHRPAVKARRGESLALLMLRGGLAGLLVACVTAAASRLGTEWSGLFMAYPIGYTVIAVTIHRQFGRDIVISTLTSTLLGTASLAVFCTCLSLALRDLSAYVAFMLALTASLGFTTGLVVFNHFRAARQSA